MERALALAERAKGRTSPNPAVGCVIVAQGRVVGEGFTGPAGGPHAEIAALRAAGPATRGAELYTTLEPCNHYGRTPPCTDAIVAAGVAAVHCATLDPNPLVAGRGLMALGAAGVQVVVGEQARPARALNEDFARFITSGLPYVTAKYAISADGKIATRTGASRYLTGPDARRYVHRLRDTVDAVMVGAGTVIADDPELTTRITADAGNSEPAGRPPLDARRREPRHPWRLVVDSTLRVPLGARVYDPPLAGATAVLTTAAAPPERASLLEARGVEVISLPERNGRVDLAAALGELGRRGVMHLVVEGGGTLLGSLFDLDAVDRVLAFVAPLIIGGLDAPQPVAGAGAAALEQARRLLDMRVDLVGQDVLIEGYCRRAPWPEWDK